MTEIKFMDVRISEDCFLLLKETVKKRGMKIADFVEDSVMKFSQKEELHEKFFLESQQKRENDKNKRIKVRIKNKDTEERVKKICELYGIKISVFIRYSIEDALFKYKYLNTIITNEEFVKAKEISNRLGISFNTFVENGCQEFLNEKKIDHLINLMLRADDIPENMKNISVNFVNDELKRKVIEESEKQDIPLKEFIRICINYKIQSD